jgi:peptidoglycan/LPS O-acetylase OafA/YrhL
MKIYLNNLDSLGFFFAFFVLLYMAQFFKEINSYPLYSVLIFHPLLMNKFGANFLFVLILFLISYLLFAERMQTNTISLKKKCIRHALRIWPHYFAFGLLLICGTSHFFNAPGIKHELNIS